MSEGLKRLHELDLQIAESRARSRSAEAIHRGAYEKRLQRGCQQSSFERGRVPPALVTAQRTLAERSLRALNS